MINRTQATVERFACGTNSTVVGLESPCRYWPDHGGLVAEEEHASDLPKKIYPARGYGGVFRLTIITSVVLVLVYVSPVSDPGSADTLVKNFFWEADENLTGVFASRLVFDFVSQGPCEFLFSAAGTLEGESGLLLWGEEGISGASFIFAKGRLMHLHIADFDTREVLVQDGGHWGGSVSISGNFSGSQRWTLAGFDLESWNFSGGERFLPFRIEMTCDQPFDVGPLQAGREGIGFVPSFMQGGFGASANAILVEGSVQARNSASIFFTTPHALFRVKSPDFIFSAGEATLDHPQGLERWIIGPGADISFEGESGDYTLRITNAAAGTDDLYGLLVGLDSVNSLDEAS